MPFSLAHLLLNRFVNLPNISPVFHSCSRMCVNDPVWDRSRSLTRGVTIESAVSCLTIRRQYSSQIVTQTLSVKLDQHRANQSKLVSQLRLIHHHSPSQCICLSFSYSVEHSQLCVTVCLCFTRTHAHSRNPPHPIPSYPLTPRSFAGVVEPKWNTDFVCLCYNYTREVCTARSADILFVSSVNTPEDEVRVCGEVCGCTVSGGNSFKVQSLQYCIIVQLWFKFY